MKHEKVIWARDFVRDMVKKHGLNPYFVWEYLWDDYGIEKGLGCLMNGEEAFNAEYVLVNGLA